MAKWYPTLFHELGGLMIGCSSCKLHWGAMSFVTPIEEDYFSIEGAMSALIKCQCKIDFIKNLQEFEPDGWNKIKQWWEKILGIKLQNSQIITSSISEKSVEEFLREQRDNNLRAIFG